MQRLFRSPLFLVASVVFIDFVGFGLVIPVLPFWAERLGANAVGVGLVLAVYALAQFVCTPLLGSLSDRHGRRPVILLSLLVEALSFALTALAGSLPLLLCARLVGGAGASNIGSAQAVVADVTPPERRARGMGAIGAAIGLGFVVGPAAGGALAHLSPTAPFWTAAVVALANAALVWRYLPETRARRGIVSDPRRRRGAVMSEGWRYAQARPTVASLVAINLLFTLAFSGMEAIFAIFTQRHFHWSVRQAALATGYLFTYVGVIVVIMQGGLVGRLARRFGEARVLVGGLALLALGLLILPLSGHIAVLLLALAALSIGEGAVTPTSSALLSFATPREAQGAVLGLSQGVGGLGRALGPLLAGGLFVVMGPEAGFVAGALLVGAAALLAGRCLNVGEQASAGADTPNSHGTTPRAKVSLKWLLRRPVHPRESVAGVQARRRGASPAALSQGGVHVGREKAGRERDSAYVD